QVFVETNWKHKHTSHKGPQRSTVSQSAAELSQNWDSLIAVCELCGLRVRNCVEVGIVALAACKFSLRQTGSTSTQVTKVHGFAVSGRQESKLGLPHRGLRAVRCRTPQLRRGWDCCASGMQVFV